MMQLPMSLDITKIRQQFPILESGLLYLDSASTAQKPAVVMEAMDQFYEKENANVHRGMYALADKATTLYEDARVTVQKFLNAKLSAEIIFTKSCTESLNVVAKSWAAHNMKKGDVVVLSILEHHSNIVPWLQLKEEKGIDVQWIDCDDEGTLRLDDLDTLLAQGNVKLVSITGQSNVLGVRPPLDKIIKKSHQAGALVCVDGAQLIAHHSVDVQELDCDFFAFSGHKLYGPTGIGVLYGKRKLLEQMPPFLGGGTMIHEVKKDHYTPTEIPQKFEAGTPPIAEAVGLQAAIEWVSQFSWRDIEEYESALLLTARTELEKIGGVKVLGPKINISGCISFVTDQMHPHDLTEALGKKNICLRAGHHCTQPLHERLSVQASTRLSIGIYNTEKDISDTIEALQTLARS